MPYPSRVTSGQTGKKKSRYAERRERQDAARRAFETLPTPADTAGNPPPPKRRRIMIPVDSDSAASSSNHSTPPPEPAPQPIPLHNIEFLDDMDDGHGDIELDEEELDQAAADILNLHLDPCNRPPNPLMRSIGVDEDQSDDEEQQPAEEELPVEDAAEKGVDDEGLFDWDKLFEDAELLAMFDGLNDSYEARAAELASKLSELDMEICRAFVYKVETHTADAHFSKIPYAFSLERPLPSLTKIRRRIAFISGLKPEFYDCCANSCCCYVGPNAELELCPICKERRYRADGKPRKRFTYIPLIPRLIAFFRNSNYIKLLAYRSQFETEDDVIKDIFDGSRYRSLCQVYVEVEGKKMPYKFFSDPRDLALGLSTDGYGPFNKRKKTAWPLIIFLYNLPPEIRFHLKHILSIGVIPGPKKPVDIDSFLYPLVRELLRLALGVKAFDVTSAASFRLRAYLLALFGDMPAVSMVMRMKGHNGISPCRSCKIIAVKRPGDKTYYVPHDRSFLPDDVPSVDPATLARRTHKEFLEQADAVEHALSHSSKAEAERLAKAHGIKGRSILTHLSSLSFPDSFPEDFMHLVFENTLTNLVSHWFGDFKGLDDGKEEYTLMSAVIEGVGKAGEVAGSTIPSVYGPRLPDISKSRAYVSAEMWSFWMLYLGPVLLRKSFRRVSYFKHFVDFVKLVGLCLQFELSSEDVSRIRAGFIKWVKDYERIYLQKNVDRISASPLTIHSLLHIADCIERMGPVWCYWAFPMERFCGLLKPAIRSRRFPWASLDRFVVEMAQLTHIKIMYGLEEELLLGPPRQPIDGFKADEYKTCMLLPPRRGRPSDNVIQGIAGSLVTVLGKGITANAVKLSLENAVISEWSKVRRIDSDDGETMVAASVGKAREDKRDASFIRYQIVVDRNARRRNAAPLYQDETHYGQLEHIFSVEFRAPCLTLKKPQTFFIVAVRECKELPQDPVLGGLDVHFYSKMGRLLYFDMSCVQALVGRVPDGPNKWALIDRSGALARATWDGDQLQESGLGDDNNLV